MISTKLHLAHTETLQLNWNSSLVLFLAVSCHQECVAPVLCQQVTCQSSVISWPQWDMWLQMEGFSSASTGVSPITKERQRSFNSFSNKVKLSDFLKATMKVNSRLHTTVLPSKKSKVSPLRHCTSHAPELADKPHQFYPIHFPWANTSGKCQHIKIK